MGKGRYIILIGNYGSGKTEIALNIAIRAAARGERTQVIDLDKVNDYFRMSDRGLRAGLGSRRVRRRRRLGGCDVARAVSQRFCRAGAGAA